MESGYVFTGILEIVAAGVTVLGVLLAFRKYIIDDYAELIKAIRDRNDMTLRAIDFDIQADDPSVRDGIAYNNFTIWDLEERRDEYRYRHPRMLVIGIIVMLGYAIALLTGEIPVGFFVTMIVIIIGMGPSVIDMLGHKNRLRKVRMWLRSTEPGYDTLRRKIAAYERS